MLKLSARTSHIAVLCCIALCVGSPILGADKAAPKVAAPARGSQPTQPTEPVTPAPPAQLSPPPVSPVTQAALQSGVLTCVSRINQVVTFLTDNTKSSAFLFVPVKQPDQSLFSVSIQTQDLTGATRYASASFAPTTSGQTAAVYDTVEYVAQAPDAVEKSVFKDLKRKGTLGKDMVILDGGALTIFLMPAGPGCIVIKKEIVQ